MFSDPILCSLNTYEYTKEGSAVVSFVKLFLVQSLPQDLLDTYCYIHGTFTVGEAGPAGQQSGYSLQGLLPYQVRITFLLLYSNSILLSLDKMMGWCSIATTSGSTWSSSSRPALSIYQGEPFHILV